jgi:SNF2 family DNA or RNA helicase
MIVPEINKLASMIDLGRDHQNSAVLWGLKRLLDAKQCGIILGDEVGCGKTYEALAILALLWHHYQKTETPVRRVLILCKSGLIRKWYEELTTQTKLNSKENSESVLIASSASSEHGIQAHLKDKCFDEFNEKFLRKLNLIENLSRSDKIWNSRGVKGFRGVREGDKVQAPEGLYLVNQHLLHESTRGKSNPIKYIYKTDWDLVILDEAHHFGKGRKCDSIFASASGKKGKPEFCREGTLNFRHIMLLTATPFELDPREMLNLLRITRASEQDIENLDTSLRGYQHLLGRFYDLRMLSPDNERRQDLVKKLRLLRTGSDLDERLANISKLRSWREPACFLPASEGDGLESIMRRYIVRNLKETKRLISTENATENNNKTEDIIVRRDYSLVNKEYGGFIKCQFDKFDDLKAVCSNHSLIPFMGPDALFYFQFREIIQEIIDSKHKGKEDRGAFVAMDLQQGLSSYPQVIASQILLANSSELSIELSNLLKHWDDNKRFHPKVNALLEIVRLIIALEIKRVESDPKEWFGKIVIFNKLVSGTAPHLRKHLKKMVDPLLEDMLSRSLRNTTFINIKDVKENAKNIVREETDIACKWFTQKCKEKCENCDVRRRTCKEHCDNPELDVSKLNDAGFKGKESKHAIEVLRPYFEEKATLDLFLIDFFRNCRESGIKAENNSLRDFICKNIISPSVVRMYEVIDDYLDDKPNMDEFKRLGRAALYESGIRYLALIREKLRSTKIVARYDGEVTEDRESNRINFNGRWNPLILIVSRAGEEGIDLQTHTKYILHYDLEWNPAKMEQREGRVDREGYGHEGEPIDVRFFLLKGTYEERIFHTVMQRDQWFQILMGSQRKRLGQISDDEDCTVETADQDLLARINKEARKGNGFLTPEEKRAVMLDLRPPSADVYEKHWI